MKEHPAELLGIPWRSDVQPMAAPRLSDTCPGALLCRGELGLQLGGSRHGRHPDARCKLLLPQPRAGPAASARHPPPPPPPPEPTAPQVPCPAVLDRSEYAALRQELAELKQACVSARGGARAGHKVRPGQLGRAPGTDAPPEKMAASPASQCPYLSNCHCAVQLESALVAAARQEAAAREEALRAELDKAQAAAREQLEKAARARRMHEQWAAWRCEAGGPGTCS